MTCICHQEKEYLLVHPYCPVHADEPEPEWIHEMNEDTARRRQSE